MKEKLEKTLSERDRLEIEDDSLVSAAVLIPLLEKDGEYHLLFTKRTDTLRDHKGQVSFPGGRCEKHDITPLVTALRESYEEIGLGSEIVEILGALDDRPTMHTNYLITPYVGVIPWPCELNIDPVEVDEVFTVPVSALLDKDTLRQEDDPVNDGTSEGYFYYCDNRIIWGATARIITQFLDIWSRAANNN
jgi:8-oxo-dGTP pyrophosphatase MutT (NUDIX family)